jgi:hypothetical protein
MDEIDRAWRDLQADGGTDAPLVRPMRTCIGCAGRPTRVLVIWATDPKRGPIVLHGYVCNDCAPDLTGLAIVQLFEYGL